MTVFPQANQGLLLVASSSSFCRFQTGFGPLPFGTSVFASSCSQSGSHPEGLSFLVAAGACKQTDRHQLRSMTGTVAEAETGLQG